jgi:hypothetical protein
MVKKTLIRVSKDGPYVVTGLSEIKESHHQKCDGGGSGGGFVSLWRVKNKTIL